MSYYTARVSIGNDTVRDIPNDHASGSNHRPFPDFHSGNNRCAGSNPRTLAHMHISAQRTMWRHMNIVLQYTLMVNRCTRIDNTVFTDFSTGLHNSSLHNNRSIAHFSRRRHYRTGMYRLLKPRFQPFRNHLSDTVVANTDN